MCLTLKTVRQEFFKVQITKFNRFLLAFEGSNENASIVGWKSFRFLKELFVTDKDNWYFLDGKLGSNIRLFYPLVETDFSEIIKEPQITPILYYYNGVLLLNEQIKGLVDSKLIRKIVQFLPVYQKFIYIIKGKNFVDLLEVEAHIARNAINETT